ncbi:MobC family plasmid mobilization relaxosome protein (plasmid) [Citricoccus sp. SGAir0253]|nr:MobC family plasmid mobilization relaxosome protein [Citricoccus sp. SGAir0253]
MTGSGGPVPSTAERNARVPRSRAGRARPATTPAPAGPAEPEQAIQLGALTCLRPCAGAPVDGTLTGERRCTGLEVQSSKSANGWAVVTVAERKRQSNVVGGRPARRVVKLSASEDAALSLAAVEQGVTVPRLLKESALAVSAGETATDRRRVLTALNVLTGQLARVGNNLNQIARGLNTDGELHGDVRGSLDELRGVLRDVDEVIETLALDRGAP